MGNFTTKMYWLHCLSPLQVGSGEGAGYIDNPIMREKVTGWPFVPGSSVKGVIADRHGAGDEEKRNKCNLLKTAFGSGGDDQANAGALIFSDAHLICLPARSLYGTFAWITSPLVLQRLKRDWSQLSLPLLDTLNDENNILITSSSILQLKEKVFLEDLDLDVGDDKDKVTRLATCLAQVIWSGTDTEWRMLFQQRFAVVSDAVFDFLTQTATQIDTRIRICPEQKTVAPGALWTEESLPAESILAGVVWQDEARKGSNDLQMRVSRL